MTYVQVLLPTGLKDGHRGQRARAHSHVRKFVSGTVRVNTIQITTVIVHSSQDKGSADISLVSICVINRKSDYLLCMSELCVKNQFRNRNLFYNTMIDKQTTDEEFINSYFFGIKMNCNDEHLVSNCWHQSTTYSPQCSQLQPKGSPRPYFDTQRIGIPWLWYKTNNFHIQTSHLNHSVWWLAQKGISQWFVCHS